jgi:hypothetical protein
MTEVMRGGAWLAADMISMSICTGANLGSPRLTCQEVILTEYFSSKEKDMHPCLSITCRLSAKIV